jgi:chaperonin GroEL (HSP60 family)
MENQKKNKIIASALVCLVAFFAICLLLGTNIRINQNKAELASFLKKLRFDIEGEIVDTHINSGKRSVVVDENELDASDIVTNTISYLDDYFEDENVISLKKVEEDENLRLYKLQFKIGDKVSEFYVTKDGENIFLRNYFFLIFCS